MRPIDLPGVVRFFREDVNLGGYPVMRDRLHELASKHGLSPDALRELEQLVDDATPRVPTVRLGSAIDPSDIPQPIAELAFKARYEVRGRIGSGGFSEVREAWDRHVQRGVALKIQLPTRISEEDTARFRREVLITAGLQHPGIVPVYDWGELEDGRIWFSMKRVLGRTMAELVRDLHSLEGAELSLALRRHLDHFQRLCGPVAYAHSHGVIHRDISPANLMVGDLGEVHVMDWGLARALSMRPDGLSEIDADFRSTLSDPAEGSVRTRIAGTPYYMPPEQARGDISSMSARSDVYAFGAVLYEILSGHAPYADDKDARDSPVRLIAHVRTGPPRPIETVARPQAPKELLQLCRKAMEREPEQRFAHAGELMMAVRDWLDGVDRKARAKRIVDEAREEHATRLANMREQATLLRAQAREILDRLRPFDRAQEKAEGWRLEDEAGAVEQAMLREEISWTQKLRSALNEAPDLEEAHAALAAHYEQSLLRADSLHDEAAAMSYAALLEDHVRMLPLPARQRYEALLQDTGRLTLVTEPNCVEVSIQPYTPVNRYLMPDAKKSLVMTTPVVERELPRGSYRLTLSAPGYRAATYPVFLGRSEHWDGTRPGGREPHPIRLLRTDELGVDDIYVPAGWFIAGGDPRAGESLSKRRVWVDAFVIRKYPVTNEEYLAFLNALRAQGRYDEARRYCPGPFPGMEGRGAEPQAYHVDEKTGLYVLRGPLVERTVPVVSVDWYAASAYAAYYAQKTGLLWRLPSELEWEKAARGVDGRFMPWGDQIEPTWACVSGSHSDRKHALRIDQFPTDISPYGVCGMAGNVRDWCLEPWSLEGPCVENGILQVDVVEPGDDTEMPVRGGAWISTGDLMRLCVRYAERPTKRHGVLGFRLARSLRRS